MGEISKRELFPPLASLLAPENCRYHAASKGLELTDLVAPFRVQPLCGSRRGRTIGSQPLRVVSKGRDSGQSGLVVLSQPQTKLTAPSQP